MMQSQLELAFALPHAPAHDGVRLTEHGAVIAGRALGVVVEYLALGPDVAAAIRADAARHHPRAAALRAILFNPAPPCPLSVAWSTALDELSARVGYAITMLVQPPVQAVHAPRLVAMRAVARRLAAEPLPGDDVFIAHLRTRLAQDYALSRSSSADLAWLGPLVAWQNRIVTPHHTP